MKLVVFGLSLTSSWGNGHATTYRALLRAFSARGHEIVFFEWDAPWYRPHRDEPDPEYVTLHLYRDWAAVRAEAIAEAREADAVLVGSYVRGGAGVIDALLAAGVEPLVFYDIDTPVTAAGLRAGDLDYLRRDQVPRFARYLSFTGGPFLSAVIEGELGAREAAPLYCSVDETRYRPCAPDATFAAELAYMGTYAPDRQPVVDRLLCRVAERLPERRFLVAGPQYPAELGWPPNVRRMEHVAPARHPRFYCSAAWQLNATRADMVAAGWSPSVRLFEAAACAAPLISDAWPGMEDFLTPGREILTPASTGEAVEILRATHPDDRRALGAAARARVLASHTAAHRAAELEQRLGAAVAA